MNVEGIFMVIFLVPIIAVFVVLPIEWIVHVCLNGDSGESRKLKKFTNFLKKFLWFCFGLVIITHAYNDTLSRSLIINYVIIRVILFIVEVLIKKASKIYDENGYDKEGYNKRGYNKKGYNREGYDRNGRTENRINRGTGTKYDSDGFNKNGFNRYGIHRDTGTKYDENGYDKDGFNKDGWTTHSSCNYGNNLLPSINKQTKTYYDKEGYDMKGFDKNGFDRYGKHKDTHDYYDGNRRDKDGFNKNGRNKDKINKYTGTKYNRNGFDFDGYDRDGFDKDGFDISGIDRRGFPHDYYLYDGFGWEYKGKNNIYTGTKYDIDGLDYYGKPEKKEKKIKKSSKETTKTLKENSLGNKKKKGYNSLKICSIASGSNGNCYYIGNNSEAILIDDGISYKQFSSRMKESGLDINSVKGIFISHEHVDHIKGLAVFYKNHPDVPIYFNKSAYNSVGSSNDPGVYKKGVVNLEEGVINLSGFKIYSFKKKHDSRYPLSFRVEYNGISIGVFTDIGESCAKFRNHFSKCNAVFLETNHDVTMLRNGSYPDDLKERVYQNHFSNDNAYNMLKKYANPKLQIVILSHISKDNNSHSKILDKFGEFNKKYKLEIASREHAGNVYDIK